MNTKTNNGQNGFLFPTNLLRNGIPSDMHIIKSKLDYANKNGSTFETVNRQNVFCCDIQNSF